MCFLHLAEPSSLQGALRLLPVHVLRYYQAVPATEPQPGLATDDPAAPRAWWVEGMWERSTESPLQAEEGTLGWGVLSVETLREKTNEVSLQSSG